MREQRWNGRPGCWKAICNLEDLLEGNLTERERDLFEYAYMKGFDAIGLPKAIDSTAPHSEAEADTDPLPFEPSKEEPED